MVLLPSVIVMVDDASILDGIFYPSGQGFACKDGVFALFANAYNMGQITQDQVALVHGRYTAYESVFNKWYKDELEKYYVDEHLTE